MKITSIKPAYNFNIKQRTKNNSESRFDAVPAFKGGVKSKTNIIQWIINLFKKKKPVQQVVQAVEKKELPFDGVARLKFNKISPALHESFLTTANGNQQHFSMLMRMKKTGISENDICEVFQSCKNHDGQLKIPLYNAALFVKENRVPSKYVKGVLNNFRLTYNTFDYDGFKKYITLKEKVSARHSNARYAFCTQPDEVVDNFFFSNINKLKKVVKHIGDAEFLKISEYNQIIFEYRFNKILQEIKIADAEKRVRPRSKKKVLPSE